MLDVGCAFHNLAQTDIPSLLHCQLADVASEIVGIDIETAGVNALLEAGYDVIEADVSGDISELLARGRFDVVTAGEVLEHLNSPIDLFRFRLADASPWWNLGADNAQPILTEEG